jgi:hypothetical protein
MYARVGRPSIAPAKLLRAQLLEMLYSTIRRGSTAHHGDFGPSRVRTDLFELITIPALAPHPGRCKRPDFVEPNYGYCSFCQLPIHQTRFYGNSECGDWTSVETEDLHMQRQRLVSRRNELVTQT